MPPRSFENLGQIPAASLKLLAGSGFKVSGWNGCWLPTAGRVSLAFTAPRRGYRSLAFAEFRALR